MKLTAIREIKGEIVLKSGLRIGAGDMEMQIGGTDNPIIKHPHTQEPYIPGSSIKGKVRSLLEMKSGLMIHTNGEPLQPKDLDKLSGDDQKEAEKILKLFGSGGSAEPEEKARLGPTRVSFADCALTDKWLEKAREQRLALIEVKSENRIDRIRGTARDPRFMERVPAGTKFEFGVSLKILDPNEEKDLLDCLLLGLKLLEMDALGGSGSRGYGRIEFNFTDKAVQEKFKELNPF